MSIRKIGDQGQRVKLFDELRVVVDADPKDVCGVSAGQVTGTIYRAYINLEDRTGLVCVNIDTGQSYFGEVIQEKFSLLVEPYQIIKVLGNTRKVIKAKKLLMLDTE